MSSGFLLDLKDGAATPAGSQLAAVRVLGGLRTLSSSEELQHLLRFLPMMLCTVGSLGQVWDGLRSE